jgi:hypothetical protein
MVTGKIKIEIVVNFPVTNDNHIKFNTLPVNKLKPLNQPESFEFALLMVRLKYKKITNRSIEK